jgi:chromosome segregation protein
MILLSSSINLNSIPELRGRFIVLPNVSEGGGSTLLRKGFHQKYKFMPCVGGYLDGPVSQHGTGNISITSGKNREYGFKPIGLFQTSDNRTRTFSELGKYSTWVKWARPTAEALRQACLAKESRLYQEDPQIPSIWITGVDVSNSKFIGPTDWSLILNTIQS